MTICTTCGIDAAEAYRTWSALTGAQTEIESLTEQLRLADAEIARLTPKRSPLRDARLSAKLNQGEVGKRLNPPRSHAAVSDIERGKTALTTDLLEQFAAIYGVAPAVLAGWAS